MDKKPQRKTPGSLRISRDVLASIARIAALEVEGVAELSDNNYYLPRAIYKKVIRKPIHINLNDDWAEVEINIIIKFGENIPDVCGKIQNKVKENIQTMTGIIVPKVNIVVAGISLPGDEAEETTESDI